MGWLYCGRRQGRERVGVGVRVRLDEGWWLSLASRRCGGCMRMSEWEGRMRMSEWDQGKEMGEAQVGFRTPLAWRGASFWGEVGSLCLALGSSSLREFGAITVAFLLF